jgi:hypothetical protein
MARRRTGKRTRAPVRFVRSRASTATTACSSLNWRSSLSLSPFSSFSSFSCLLFFFSLSLSCFSISRLRILSSPSRSHPRLDRTTCGTVRWFRSCARSATRRSVGRTSRSTSRSSAWSRRSPASSPSRAATRRHASPSADFSQIFRFVRFQPTSTLYRVLLMDA